MLTRWVFMGSLLTVVLGGCGGYSEKQWMKVNQSYTTEEFRRDHKACSKGIVLDEDCMRAKGWIDLKPAASDRPADTPAAPTRTPQDFKYRR